MTETYYWIVLMNDGTYVELSGTEKYVDDWMKRMYPSKTYRKVIWND